MSLIGNAVLGAMLLSRNRTTDSAPVAPVRLAPPNPPSPSPPTKRALPDEIRVSEAWQTLRLKGDIKGTVENLRAAGFPRAVIQAAAEKMADEQMLDQHPTLSQPYWRRARTPELNEQITAYEKTRRSLLESALGPDGTPAARLGALERVLRYGDLTDEKINAIVRIDRDYSDVRNQVFAQQRGLDGTKMMEQHFLAEKARREDLEAVMTPEELRQYELRTSSEAFDTTHRLRNAEVTES